MVHTAIIAFLLIGAMFFLKEYGNKENNEKNKFLILLDLGEYYKKNHIEKADSIRKVILEKSRPFNDTLRFNALHYNVDVCLLTGNIKEYHKHILAFQSFLKKLDNKDTRYKIFKHLGIYHVNMQEYDIASFYFKGCYKIGIKERNFNRQSESLNFISKTYMYQGKKDTAVFFSKRALQAARRTKNKMTLAKSFNTQARIYSFFGQPELSIAKNIIALQLIERIPESEWFLAKYTREIGDGQMTIFNNSGAKYYYNRSLNNAKKIHDNRQNALALVRIALTLLNEKEHEQAIKKGKQAVKLFLQLNDDNGLGEAYEILGKVYLNQKKYDLASSHFNQALIHFESASNKNKIATVYYNVGIIFKAKKEYIRALNYLMRSNEILINSGKHTYQTYQTYRVISEIYEELNRPAEALKYLKQYLNYTDSNTILQAATKIAELNETYRAEQRERLIQLQADSIDKQIREQLLTKTRLENAELKNSFQLYIISAILIIMLLAGVILFYRWNQTKIKQQQKEAEMAQTLLRTQMNPHFVFNAMSVIQSFIFENDTVNSSKFLVSFSRLMRLILENSPKQYIPIETEIDILNKYLEIQKLRFQDRFEYKINVEEELVSLKTLIPPMITQPFIENAIEHGQLHTIENGFIHVSFKKENNMLKISIIDNGVGREKSKKNKKSYTHKSMAMDITNRRIQLLNKKFNTQGRLIVKDYDESLKTGTKVLISLPFITEADV